jgi:hypothetical protein
MRLLQRLPSSAASRQRRPPGRLYELPRRFSRWLGLGMHGTRAGRRSALHGGAIVLAQQSHLDAHLVCWLACHLHQQRRSCLPPSHTPPRPAGLRAPCPPRPPAPPPAPHTRQPGQVRNGPLCATSAASQPVCYGLRQPVAVDTINRSSSAASALGLAPNGSGGRDAQAQVIAACHSASRCPGSAAFDSDGGGSDSDGGGSGWDDECYWRVRSARDSGLSSTFPCWAQHLQNPHAVGLQPSDPLAARAAQEKCQNVRWPELRLGQHQVLSRDQASKLKAARRESRMHGPAPEGSVAAQPWSITWRCCLGRTPGWRSRRWT